MASHYHLVKFVEESSMKSVRHFGMLACAAILSNCCTTANAQVTVIPVGVDGYVTRTDPGNAFTLDTTSTQAMTTAQTLNLAGQPEFEESRTLLEFDLSSIPTGSTITGVSLDVYIRSNRFFDPEGARTVSFFGYNGDGVLSVTDADAGVPVPVFSAALTNHSLLLQTLSLDPTFVQSALDVGAFAGLNLRLPPSVMASVGIVTQENPDIPPFSAASLTVTYTAAVSAAPEPATVALLSIGVGMVVLVTRRRIP